MYALQTQQGRLQNILERHEMKSCHSSVCSGRGGRVIERRVFGRGDWVRNHLLPFRNLGNFVHPTLPVSFGRDTKCCWSLLSGVCVSGSKISHTGKWKRE